MAQISEYRTVCFDSVLCCACGVEFMMPRTLFETRRDDGDSFYCPNGHSQHFIQSTKSQLEKSQAEVSALKTQVQLERDQKAAAEQSMERLKKKISKGVCPCCKRTFSQLARHMEDKHPNYPKAK